jgi:hypothetical protein
MISVCNIISHVFSYTSESIDHREYYKVEIHAIPAQEGYEIGSEVILNCTATPSPQTYENFTFPLRYQWYFPDGRSSYSSSSSTITITIDSKEQLVRNYYCLIYRNIGGLLLGQGRKTITTKSNCMCLLLLAI